MKFNLLFHFHNIHLLLVRFQLQHHHHLHLHHHFLYIPKWIFFLQKARYELHVLLLEFER